MSAEPSDLPMTKLNAENLRVYVIHYTRLSDRRTHMEKVVSESGLECYPLRWVVEHDREEIESRHASGEFGDPVAFGASFVSVILKHLEVFHRVAESTVPFHLILEDDVFITEDWKEKLGRMLRTMPEDWEILFVGDGCDLHVPFWRRFLAGRSFRDGGVFFRGWDKTWWGGGGISRCGAGYLIRPESARRFLTSAHSKPPFSVPIDWLMNRVGAELKMRSYWAEPPLVTQGAFESWTKDRNLNPKL
jgi:glycosyl transferase family 25